MPIQDGFHIELCDWANGVDRDALLQVRATVFVAEQHVPRELEVDGEDPRCTHALARASGGDPVGAGRLGPDGRIGRMAVLRDWRGRGVGSALLHTLLGLASTRHLGAVTLHAQQTAVPFYRDHGFATTGERFEEAGIWHVPMRRALHGPPAPPPPVAVALHATTREELIAATQTLLSGARHRLCMWARELHPLLLDDTACLVELRRLAISGRGASIRILALDVTRARHEGNRMLDLAQHLSSVIELRRPVEQPDVEYPSAFACVDTQGYLLRPLAGAMAATGSTCAPGRHAQLLRVFDDAWARSEPWSELRVLDL